jgi:hypothetical protein
VGAGDCYEVVAVWPVVICDTALDETAPHHASASTAWTISIMSASNALLERAELQALLSQGIPL